MEGGGGGEWVGAYLQLYGNFIKNKVIKSCVFSIM